MNNIFAYTDDIDKCYGLTGMVISLNVFDNDSMLREISLDDADGNLIHFTPDFYFNGNPRFSAKIAWNEMLKQYQLMMGMLMGNILCRYNVGKHQSLTQDNINDMHRLIEDEGHDECQLEDDEIDMLFNKTLRYLSGIYRDRQIHDIANGFVAVIKDKRTLSGDEVIDLLRYLKRR